MKWVILFLFISYSMYSQSLIEVQNNYIIAVKDKKICKQMIEFLEKDNKSSINLGYLGAYQTVWANHAINPLQKLNTFTKGKKNLEAAIIKDSKNIELRYLRYSIQKNAPKFLNYNQNLKEDFEILEKEVIKITNPVLKQNIQNLIK